MDSFEVALDNLAVIIENSRNKKLKIAFKEYLDSLHTSFILYSNFLQSLDVLSLPNEVEDKRQGWIKNKQ